MAQLPSYQDAVSRLDWLELVAPHVQDKDFASLCSVNRRFYAIFAPRLWNDPLVAVRRLGLDPSDDLEWYLDFVFDRLQQVRQSTLALITTLDFRSFAKDTAHFSSDNGARTIPETLRHLPRLLPGLRCVLLDGHVEVDPAFLMAAPQSEAAPANHDPCLLVLSAANCEIQLPSAFFASERMQNLVYLDISGLPGSLQPLSAAAYRRRNLAHLKILKVRRREMNDSTAMGLFQAFKGALWSLDISQNNVTDTVVDLFAASCFRGPSLRSHSRFMTEGKLISNGHGNDSNGRFMSIQESDWSGTFTHPERHFVDAPIYSADASRNLQEDEAVRSNGNDPLRRDTVDHIKAVIAGGMDQPVPEWSDVPHLQVCTSPAGITHLHLSDTQITSSGVDRLIRNSQGQLEELSCDAPKFQPVRWSAVKQPIPWLRSLNLHGALGCAHLFRPVFSSNLRVLRMHHSLVTQIPTVEAEGLSTTARLLIAETVVRERSELAFPQAFEPDMNPRLTSLTLTKIPPRSIGPLIDKLVHFLKLAGLQEQAIWETTPFSSRRSPALLRGLRHLHLAFEADPIEDPAGVSTSQDLDAEGLMDMDEGEGFSFFSDERSHHRPENATKKQVREGDDPAAHFSKLTTGRLNHFPFNAIDDEFLDYRDTWSGQSFDRHVWVGPGVLGANAAVNEYTKLVTNSSLRTRVGPATPAHVKAGVPAGALLFHAAWDAIVMPLPLELRPPETAKLHRMRNVLEAIKQFRVQSRAEYEAAERAAAVGSVAAVAGPRHCFWSGRLEVSAQKSMAHYRAPHYWR